MGLRFSPEGIRFCSEGLRFSPGGLRFSPGGLRFSPEGLRFSPRGLRPQVFVFGSYECTASPNYSYTEKQKDRDRGAFVDQVRYTKEEGGFPRVKVTGMMERGQKSKLP